ncbi:MAG: preprotein translocase subunit SecE [Candidatus Wildermuthbacteria bacterium]|nr:preprotein translocase subunit SecE [Candidatus Wildermuthbacteria bacterium]
MNIQPIIQSIRTFFDEVRLEAKKVNWPTKNETINKTLIVLGFSIAIALLLGTFDVFFTAVIKRFIIQ